MLILIDSVVDDVDIGDEEVKQRTILRAKKRFTAQPGQPVLTR